MSLRRQLLVAVLVLGTIGPACAAPVLPLPPPAALVEGPPYVDVDGFVTITGVVSTEGAFVGCLNEDTEGGVLVRSDPMTGEFTCRLLAMSGHEIRVWQFVDSGPGGEPVFLTVP